MFEMMEAWDQQMQFQIVLALVLVGGPCVTLTTLILARMVVLLVRGRPPMSAPEVVKPCPSDNSLTGTCIRAGGCKSSAECDRMLEET